MRNARQPLRLLGGLPLLVVVASCAPATTPTPVRVFHAAGLAPLLHQVRDDCERDLGITLLAESSGSQEACRKVTELGRTCDLLVLADNQLVAALLGDACRWRVDFATDECVLGVGARAPSVEKAEKDWSAAVLDERARLARVNENLGPIGYRTLLTLRLQEQLDGPGLYERFVGKCRTIVDDVERLPPLLRSGEVDYAILYRSTCIAHAVRYIELDKRVNLGAPDVDYGRAEVRFARLKSGPGEMIAVRGSPIVWSAVGPRGAENDVAAEALVLYLLSTKADDLDRAGLRPLVRARFFGPRDIYSRFREVADYAGELP